MHCDAKSFYPSLARNGQRQTPGSVSHPSGCTPCVFYCFKNLGCESDKSCAYCHMEHISKQQLRRKEWKRCRRIQRISVQAPVQPICPSDSQSAFPQMRDVFRSVASCGVASVSFDALTHGRCSGLADQGKTTSHVADSAAVAHPPFLRTDPVFISLGKPVQLFQILN